MSTLWQDFRYALRRLGQAPGVTMVCIITLALGIGANTAIFTLVDQIMLKSLPVANPQQLYRIGNDNNCCVLAGMQDNWAIFSYALYKQFRGHTPEFESMAAFEAATAELSVRRSGSPAAAQPFQGEFISGNYFSMFGLGAYAGRTINPSDDHPGAPAVAVMNYRTWQQHFGLDPTVIGSAFAINQVTYTVVGIAPPGFFGDTLRPNPPDFWLPLATEPMLNQQNSVLNHDDLHWLYIIGRMKPGVKISSVQSEVTVELQRWLGTQPDLSTQDRAKISKQHIGIAPAGGGVANLEQQTKQGLQFLMIISGLVLLIACANIANLLLARGASTRFDTAVRMALGAPRHRLFRQVITESVLLAVAGGLAGLIVAFTGTRMILLIAFRGAQFIPISPTPSWPVLAFAFVLSLLTGVVFGMAPAWMTSHSNPAEALRGAGRSTRDRSSAARKSLVVVQVALSTALLIGAGLLTQTLRNLEDQNFGFQPEHRVDIRVNPALAGYRPEKLYGLYQQLQQRLPQIPGVISATYSLYSPMRGDNWGLNIHIEGHPPDEEIGASFDRVGPHYFETIGTRVVRGRSIGEQDTPTSPMVAVVNEAFVKKFFPKEDPLGKYFGMGGDAAHHSRDFEIVGVVQDAKYQDARGPAYPTFFLPFLQIVQDPKLSFTIGSHYVGDIELHVVAHPQNLEVNIRHTLAEIDPNLTVLDLLSMPEQLSRNFNQDRLITRLTILFGVLALVLACVGLYGVTSYSVARRTSEIGLRMALGADRGRVVRLVLRGALLQLALGLAIGLPISLAGGHYMASQLYGVKSYDPIILGLAVLCLSVCALVAGYLPARRAASVDPLQALRAE